MGFFGEMSKRLNLLITNIDFRVPAEAPYGAYVIEQENYITADSKVVYSEKEIAFYLYHTKNDKVTEAMTDSYFYSKNMMFEKENNWIKEEELIETVYLLQFNKTEEL